MADIKPMAVRADEVIVVGSGLAGLSDPASTLRLTKEAAVLCWNETRNIVLIARLVTLAALRREESRGAHYRDDCPNPKHV